MQQHAVHADEFMMVFREQLSRGIISLHKLPFPVKSSGQWTLHPYCTDDSIGRNRKRESSHGIFPLSGGSVVSALARHAGACLMQCHLNTVEGHLDSGFT